MEGEDSTSTIHDIFRIDPGDLLKFVDSFVEVRLNNQEVILGKVYSIDPVTGSVVLIEEDKKAQKSMKIILKHSISSIHFLKDNCTDQKNVDTSKLFKERNSDGSSMKRNLSKEEVKSWLLKNMVPVIERGDILLVDNFEIHPPYDIDQCYCSNPTILSRIQKILKAIP